jgi:hypothetical protein
MDFTPWVTILSDPSVAVASLFGAVVQGFGVGIIVLALSLVSRAE